MIKTYEYGLPRNHFDSLYGKVGPFLASGENVLISAIYGCASSIFLNLFLRLNKEDKTFPNLFFYDPVTQNTPLVKFVKKLQKSNKDPKLLIIRLFENIENKREALEELHSLKQPDPKNITYLVFSDHTGLIKPDDFTALSSPFFNGRFHIGPFNFNPLRRVI